MDTNILYYVILAPFSGFLFNILFGSYSGKAVVSVAGCLAVIASFIISASAFFTHFYSGAGDPIVSESIRWIDLQTFSIDISLYVDRLTIIMMLVVTGVGSLIHIYSVGYMHDDKRFSRYFAFINLFTAFMLLLIMGKNMFMMFVGWEGVGLCSYLLIGFWFDDKEKGVSNSLAGMKAFIVNRVGDLSFTIGLLILFTYLGDRFGIWTLDIPSIRETVGKNSALIDTGVITLVCILLFGGACGKSAQIPLYVWLPDAMAGPTPVSALIHAATMVTAGVYMVARFNFIYTLSPTAMTVIAVVGALTAFFAATIGMTQFDIKKVLAYSTVSQLGYMFLACGVGAFAAAIFHLMTHAFFKACLFLGSGSVIHGLGGEQDIRHMGGLRKKMPVTFITFSIATLAICGIPPLAGFFSKDEILWKAFSSHLAIGKVVWALGVVTAFITAFYMIRLLILTFYGEYRGHHHAHESPKSMLFALVLLCILSVIGGLIGIPDAVGEKLSLGQTNSFEHFISKSIDGYEEPGFFDGGISHDEGHHSPMEFVLMGLSILVAFGGVFVAFIFYLSKPHMPQSIAARWKGLHGLIYDKYRVDEAYKKAVISPVVSTSVGACRFDNSVIDGTVNTVAYSIGDSSSGVGVFDNQIIDGMVNGVAGDVYAIGGGIKDMHDGNVKRYLTIGVTLSVAIMVCLWMVMEWNTVLDVLNWINL